MKPRSVFKLKLLNGYARACEAAVLLAWWPTAHRRLMARAVRFYLALSYVAARETHNYKGEPVPMKRDLWTHAQATYGKGRA